MTSFKKILVNKTAAIALAVGSVSFGAIRSHAQVVPAVDSAPAVLASAYQPASIDTLKQLASPIALYPDAILAQVLVASTYPNDVSQGGQYLRNGGDSARMSELGLDASVAGLAQTPDILYQLADNADWMNQLGSAFLNQQQDVFTAVQLLRRDAIKLGNLVSTAQIRVIDDGGYVQIVPANPQIIYVPRYDPRIVYVTRCVDVGCPPISFGGGVSVGLWLCHDFDWCDHHIYTGNWGCDRSWWSCGHEHDEYQHHRPGVDVTNVTNITNVNNNTNVNRNTNVNVNRNTNVNTNTNVNRNTNVNTNTNRNTNVNTATWTRNPQKPGPTQVNRPAVPRLPQPAPAPDPARRGAGPTPKPALQPVPRPVAAVPTPRPTNPASVRSASGPRPAPSPAPRPAAAPASTVAHPVSQATPARTMPRPTPAATAAAHPAARPMTPAVPRPATVAAPRPAAPAASHVATPAARPTPAAAPVAHAHPTPAPAHPAAAASHPAAGPATAHSASGDVHTTAAARPSSSGHHPARGI